MPVTITINGDNAAQAIEEFAALSASFIPAQDSKSPEETKVTRQRKSGSSKKTEPSKPVEDTEETDPMLDEDEEETDDADPEHTLVELRALAKEITTADKSKTPKVKKILTGFGYANVSAVEDRDIDKIYAKLEELQ